MPPAKKEKKPRKKNIKQKQTQNQKQTVNIKITNPVVKRNRKSGSSTGKVTVIHHSNPPLQPQYIFHPLADGRKSEEPLKVDIPKSVFDQRFDKRYNEIEMENQRDTELAEKLDRENMRLNRKFNNRNFFLDRDNPFPLRSSLNLFESESLSPLSSEPKPELLRTPLEHKLELIRPPFKPPGIAEVKESGMKKLPYRDPKYSSIKKKKG